MKRLLFVVMVLALSFSRGAAWAENPPAEKSQSVDLLNDEFKEGDASYNPSISDPLEPINRVFFEINDKIYFWLLKPISTGYAAVVPQDIRRCFGNFFDNISFPISFINNVLQGRIEDAGVVLSRFFINSTVGIFGFADAATEAFNITPRPADFGETLGVYGFGEGIYFFWPILGPSSIRDTVGYVGDVALHPTTWVDWQVPERAGYFMVDKVNNISIGPDKYEELKKYSVDPYVSARQAYFEYRRNLIEKQKH